MDDLENNFARVGAPWGKALGFAPLFNALRFSKLGSACVTLFQGQDPDHA